MMCLASVSVVGFCLQSFFGKAVGVVGFDDLLRVLCVGFWIIGRSGAYFTGAACWGRRFLTRRGS